MQSDPLYPHLAPVLAACPAQAGPLFTAFKDLALSVEWQDLRALELEGTGWAVIVGHKRDTDPLRAVLPLPLHTTSLRPSSLRQIFSAISTLSPSSLPPVVPAPAPSLQELRKRLDGDTPTSALTDADAGADAGEDRSSDIVTEALAEGANAFDTDTLYLAISTTDSSVVYYKLSKGIKKPADIPDE